MLSPLVECVDPIRWGLCSDHTLNDEHAVRCGQVGQIIVIGSVSLAR
jgi:hypothetical protein